MTARLAIVPARAGSKGIPGKNLLRIGGKSLVEIAAQNAIESQIFDYTMCSTDSVEIAEEATRVGLSVPFLRPSVYATDSSSTLDVVLNVISMLEEIELFFDEVYVIQATNPLTLPTDVIEARRVLSQGLFNSVMSITEIPHHFHPTFAISIEHNNQVRPFVGGKITQSRRQDLNKLYVRCGNVYAGQVKEVVSQKTLLPEPVGQVRISDPRWLGIDDWEDYQTILKIAAG